MAYVYRTLSQIMLGRRVSVAARHTGGHSGEWSSQLSKAATAASATATEVAAAAVAEPGAAATSSPASTVAGRVTDCSKYVSLPYPGP